MDIAANVPNAILVGNYIVTESPLAAMVALQEKALPTVAIRADVMQADVPQVAAVAVGVRPGVAVPEGVDLADEGRGEPERVDSRR